MNLYYYVCDKCGSIVDITDTPHEETDAVWVCDDCGSQAQWRFTDPEKAKQHAFMIQDKVHAAHMERLEAARRKAESMAPGHSVRVK